MRPNLLKGAGNTSNISSECEENKNASKLELTELLLTFLM